MRGTDTEIENAILSLRITPAHAGNSISFATISFCKKDHPRTCGEQSRKWRYAVCIKGSPPHMRGTELYYQKKEKMEGITPAHAGNSFHVTYCSSVCRDHPRTCGEQLVLNRDY